MGLAACRLPNNGLLASRGAADLKLLWERLRTSIYEAVKSEDVEKLCGRSMDIAPARMSLPLKAGRCRVRDHLRGEKLAQFLDMPNSTPMEFRTCCWVAKSLPQTETM